MPSLQSLEALWVRLMPHRKAYPNCGPWEIIPLGRYEMEAWADAKAVSECALHLLSSSVGLHLKP